MLHCAEASFAYLQHAREEEIAERKAMKRAERDIARKKEYVRRVRLQIEEKRAEVRFGMHQYHVLLRTPLNYLCCGYRCCILNVGKHCPQQSALKACIHRLGRREPLVLDITNRSMKAGWALFACCDVRISRVSS